MGLNDAVSAERLHVGFFGMRNAGKSSVVNAVTGQNLSVVSEVKGTTTDPVKKAMELLPLGPVVIIDTPGLDDTGQLGDKRVAKAKEMLAKADLAVLVVDGTRGLCPLDLELIALFQARKLPYLVAVNKADLLTHFPSLGREAIYVSARTGEGIYELKQRLGEFAKQLATSKQLIADLLTSGDTVLLVIPIDESAPKGRLILPQQQTIREILDALCTAIVCQETELVHTLNCMAVPPKLVVTDSQAFKRVAVETPGDLPLTSFSILFARYKGDLTALVQGAEQLSHLKTGDRVLISEGCTHHRQCNDIGTVKLPNWIERFTGAKPEFTFTSGGTFPEDLSQFSLIIHCGGCMLTETEMRCRIERAAQIGVPMVNYGVAIAKMQGILERCLAPLQKGDY